VIKNICIRLSPKNFENLIESLSQDRKFSFPLQGTLNRDKVYLYSASSYFDSVADYLPEEVVIKPFELHVFVDDGNTLTAGSFKIKDYECKWIIDRNIWASCFKKVKDTASGYICNEMLIKGLTAASTISFFQEKKYYIFRGREGSGNSTLEITVPLAEGYCSSGLINQNSHVTDAMGKRTSLLLGPEGMNKVDRICIGCIGVGGLGNHFVTAAMHLGIKGFILVDEDRLEESNLNRFYGAVREDTGKFKTSLLRREITGLHREGNVIEVREFFPSRESILELEAADILVAGLDDDRTRLLLQVYALATQRPLLDMGCGIYSDASGKPDEWGGQWRLALPGGPCLACMGLSPEGEDSCVTGGKGYLAGTGITPASIVTLSATVAAQGLSMLLRYIIGNPFPCRHVKYDELSMILFRINELKHNDCYLCGEGYF